MTAARSGLAVLGRDRGISASEAHRNRWQLCHDSAVTLARGRDSVCAGVTRQQLAVLHERHEHFAAVLAEFNKALKTPELRPQDPIDFADEIRVPVLGL